MRVLLADDHRGLLEIIQSLLKIEVEIVGCVGDGESLFDAAMELDPDIIVTDISMPRLSGLEAVDRLRESGCSSKVVFLTAHSDPDFVAAALRTGAFGYVLKTVVVKELLYAIREASEGRVFVSS